MALNSLPMPELSEFFKYIKICMASGNLLYFSSQHFICSLILNVWFLFKCHPIYIICIFLLNCVLFSFKISITNCMCMHTYVYVNIDHINVDIDRYTDGYNLSIFPTSL